MQHLIIAIIFLTNFLLWRFPLFAVSRKIVTRKPYYSYPLMFFIFFLPPYCICIACFMLLGFETSLLSNAILVIALVLLSMTFLKKSILA